MTTYRLQINGSRGSRQTARLESVLRGLAGVSGACAARDAGEVVVHGREGLLPQITREVTGIGYELASHLDRHRAPSLTRWYQHGWLR